MDPPSAHPTAAPVAVAPARVPGTGIAPAQGQGQSRAHAAPPEQAERERNGGAVSPIPMLTPVSDFLEELKDAGQRAKPYEILGPLGKGKFAMVYKAQLGSELYALKKVAIFEMMNQSSRDKCLKEIQLLQSLNHTNIIRYEDSYIDAHTSELVIVLQWARGGDLKKLIKKVRSGQAKIAEFSEGMVWKYCAQLASGLEYMHEKRVMHRDLKPANIMLSHDNQVLLGDLGLSRYFNPQTLEAFTKCGTPLYISPEVLMGTGYGFAADVWSLGCILYELCTLSSPFKPTTEGVNLYALFGNIRAGKYAPIADDGKYSENLRALITAMIRIDPTQRPSMAQVAAVARKMLEQRAAKQAQAREAHAQAQAMHAQVNGNAADAPPTQAQSQETAAAPAAHAATTAPISPPPEASPSPTSIAAAAVAAAIAASPSPSPLAGAAPFDAFPSPSPSAATAGADGVAASQSPPRLTMRFPGEPPTPLTPTRRDRAGSATKRPLNASPLPSPSSAASARAAAEMQLASAAAGLVEPRPVSPISPILGQRGRASSADGDGSGVVSVATISPMTAATGDMPFSPQLSLPPGVVVRPPSAFLRSTPAVATTTAARPISATHRPPSGSQRPPPPPSVVSPSSAADAAAAASSSPPPLAGSPGAGARPSSRQDGVARPTSKSSARPPSSSGAGFSPASSPSRQSSSSRAGAGSHQHHNHLPNGVDHFPSASSSSAAGAGAAGRSVSPSHARLGRAGSTASPLPGLSDSRDEDDSNAGEEGSSGAVIGAEHSPVQLYRNPGAQSFLYDRTAGVSSPSLSPTAAVRPAGSSSPDSQQHANGRFHHADPPGAGLPPVDEDAPASFKLAHMSFASGGPSSPPPLLTLGRDPSTSPSPPSSSTSASASASASASPDPPRHTLGVARPLSLGSATTGQQPVVALPFAHFSASPSSAPSPVSSPPPHVGNLAVRAGSGSSGSGFGASPFEEEEELYPEPRMPPPSLPVGRTRSLNREAASASMSGSPSPNPGGDGEEGDLSNRARARGSESFRRVRSTPAAGAGTTSSSPAAAAGPSFGTRLPASHFSEGHTTPDHGGGGGAGHYVPHVQAQRAPPEPLLPPRPFSEDGPLLPSAAASSLSALVASSALLPCPPPESMMEDLVESCKMLHYETRFCARFNLPWMTRDFFVHDFGALRAAQAQVLAIKQGGGKAGQRSAALAEVDAAAAAFSAAGSSSPHGLPPPASRVAVSMSHAPPCAHPTPSQQMLYFGYFVLWLLSLLATRGAGDDGVESEQLAPLLVQLRSWREYSEYRDTDEGESMERRSLLAETILAQVRPLRLALPAPALSGAALASSASGPAPLALLFRLTQSVYYKKLHGSVVLSPLALRHYPRFEPNPDAGGSGAAAAAAAGEDADDNDSGGEEVEEEEGLLDGGGGGGGDAALDGPGDHDDDIYSSFGSDHGAARSSSQPPLSEAAQLARREAAAQAWMDEWARVCESNALRANNRAGVALGQREWQQHRDAVTHHASLVLSSPLVSAGGGGGGVPPSSSPKGSASSAPSALSHLTPSSLAARSAALRGLLERVTHFERRLVAEPRFQSLADSHATTRSRLDDAAEAHASLQSANARDALELDAAEQRLADLVQEIRGAKERLDDEQGLRAIKHAIATMRGEIARFNVLLGVKAAMLQRHLATDRSHGRR